MIGGGGRRLIAAQRGDVDHAVLHVEWYIDPHRPTPASGRLMHRLFQVQTNIRGFDNGSGVFRDRTHDGNDVDFLRTHLAHAALAHEIGAFHLSRNNQKGHGFNPGAGATCDGVGAAGTSRHERDAQPAVDARIGFRSDGGGLLMMIGDIGQARLGAERVHEIH